MCLGGEGLDGATPRAEPLSTEADERMKDEFMTMRRLRDDEKNGRKETGG